MLLISALNRTGKESVGTEEEQSSKIREETKERTEAETCRTRGGERGRTEPSQLSTLCVPISRSSDFLYSAGGTLGDFTSVLMHKQ